MMRTRKLALFVRLAASFAGVYVIGAGSAEADLSCPAVTSDTTYSTTGLQTDCASGVTLCTTKSGVIYDPTDTVLKIPANAGNFQSPTGAAVTKNVFYAAAGDFDHDGWDDFVAADNKDQIYMMRNQTMTCGTTSTTSGTNPAYYPCSGSGTGPVAPSVQTIAASWWDTLTNVRNSSFQTSTTAAGAVVPIKASITMPASSGGTDAHTPMLGADFDGDGWQDFVEISYGYNVAGPPATGDLWPNAARLFLNTKNCHSSTDPAGQWTPCGVGSACAGTANGQCTGGTLVNGTAISESALSCIGSTTATAKCPYNFATFSSWDLKTGAATTAVTTTGTAPATTTPGDFGPINHAATNMQALDWDGDGDLDLLYGHSASTGACPGTLCSTTTQNFHVGIDVWINDCDAHYLTGTTSCAGYVPRFAHSTVGETLTAPAAAGQNAGGVLIPSTAHNNTTLNTNSKLGLTYDSTNLPTFAYEDIDKDGKRDLVLGSPGCCAAGNETNRLRIFKGTGAGTNTTCASPPCSFSHTIDTGSPISLSTSDATHPGFEGGFTGMYVFDFSLDGYPDLITASDNAAGWAANLGGRTRYWKNTGIASKPYGMDWPGCSPISATCNPDPTTMISEHVAPYIDFDQTFLIDYDHDPQNTKDPVITDGNTTNTFFIFPNRAAAATYAGCGTVSSGTLAAPSSEATVSGACIKPTATVPTNTGINWYLSNDGGASWNLACLQLSTTTIAPEGCCVTFSDNTGRSILWKAEFDSNTSDKDNKTPGCTVAAGAGDTKCGVGAPNGCGSSGSSTPEVTSVAANYTYTTAQQHYRAGVIVSDGVTYTGSFSQPGDRGHLYAISADFGTTYYDVSSKIDVQASRNVYTSPTLAGTGTPLAISVANANNTTLQGRIGVTATPAAAATTEATSVLTWFLGARFGVYNSGVAESKFGAVVDSTPAIIQKPFRPAFYTYLSSSDRTLYDAFATTQQNRIPLVLFGAMDGIVHAVYAISTTIADARNGQEAWGYVPPYVAAVMRSDWAASCPSGTCTSKDRTITSYPDGSPSLADFKTSGGQIATAAVFGDGNGGSEVSALDVTQTVTQTTSTTNTVQGPSLLWSAQPGTSAAGYATSKPAIARVKINNAEKFIVIAGTGVNNSDNTKGKIVAAYNLETGVELWKFEMACALTSDITIFETDDSGEDGAPTIDGYIDRAVFADQCGNVYKINPAQDLTAATPALWMGNNVASYGSVSLGASNGVTRRVLFQTSSQLTASGDDGQRPITNTIGARADSTTDVVLFFGTGGLETFNTSKPNAFFAIYAKDGSLRSGAAGRLDGSCASGRCEKFYGGVVISTDTLYLLRSKDAVIGSGTCDFGSSELDAFALNTLASTFSVTQIASAGIAASAGPLYGDAGALYFATVSGKIERIGQPRAGSAGQDSAGNTMNNSGAHEVVPGTSSFTLMGWRVAL